MADYIHISNLIQGEVLRINERRAPEERDGLFEGLLNFLSEQKQAVLIEKIRSRDQLQLDLPDPEHPAPADESAPDDH